MSNDPAITTLFGPRGSARVTPEPSAGTAWSDIARFLGRALVFLSMLVFLFSGYLAFAHYWIQTRWAASEATALSGEVRQSSLLSTSRPSGGAASSNSYFYRCVLSYPVLGQTRQSELDSPPSPYKIDAQAWAATWSPGRHIAIQYQPSNPAKVRMAGNPAELSAMGSLRVAFYFLVSGVLLMLTSRSERVDAR